MKVNQKSDVLPLPLIRRQSTTSPKALPLPLGKLDTVLNPAPSDNTPIPPKNPYPPLICGAMTAKTAQSTPHSSVPKPYDKRATHPRPFNGEHKPVAPHHRLP